MNQEPPSAADWFAAGNRQMQEGDDAAAEESFRQAVAATPELAEAHGNLGLLLERRGETAAAEQSYGRALRLKPGLIQVHLNYGALLLGQKRFDDAETAFRNAVRLAPDSAAAWTNLGVLLASCKREAEAERCHRYALELTPGHSRARFNLAYLLLRQGRFEEGWPCLEARDWYAPLESHLQCPRWQGEPLAGKSLLIGFEAGHGDMIQFCRYATLLKAQGATCVDVVCHPALTRLLSRCDGIAQAYAIDAAFPRDAWDYWCPPLSLPGHCGTDLESIPAALPYLHPEPEAAAHWAQRLAGPALQVGLRVGLVWRGNPRFENDADRSLPSLATLLPLSTVPGVVFYSLQKGAGEDEAAAPPAGFALRNLAAEIHDFADTAAIIANLDLLISVDTAVAHLAGALAKPCWLLLPDYQTDWRWLKERSDTPWYPGVMRLFRQPPGGGWESVIVEVRESLQALAADPLQGKA
ncbi:MAG TPA: tetratricopeptide repeat protein [Rhodocyclaceae bacterium]